MTHQKHHTGTGSPCNHQNSLRYARRILPNNTAQLCVQCARCLDAVKTSRHGGKLYLKQSDIPRGAVICDWIDPAERVQFDDN